MSATLAIYTADASLLTAIKKFNTEMSKRRSAQSVAEFKAKGAERMRKLHGLYEKIREWKELKGKNATSPANSNQNPKPATNIA